LILFGEHEKIFRPFSVSLSLAVSFGVIAEETNGRSFPAYRSELNVGHLRKLGKKFRIDEKEIEK
jgi:hypothetical protein